MSLAAGEYYLGYASTESVISNLQHEFLLSTRVEKGKESINMDQIVGHANLSFRQLLFSCHNFIKCQSKLLFS